MNNDDELEPFLLLFAVLAVVLGVVIFWVRGGDDAAPPAAVVAEAPIAEPTAEPEEVLPTPVPTAAPELSPASLQINVGDRPVVLTGSVPDQAAREAIVAAAAAEYGADNVLDELTIDEAITLDGGALRLTGQVDSDDARAVAGAAFTGLPIEVDNQVTVGALPTLGELAATRDDLSQLGDLLAGAGLADVLVDEGPVTIFAPTNDAISALPPEVQAKIQDPDVLSSVLQFHVVDGVLGSADVLAADSLTSLQGENIAIDAENGTVNGAPILETDLVASNGVLHVIGQVMVPGTIATELQLAQLVLDPIQFASGSADLLPESQAILDEAAEVLLAQTVGNVSIQGHTDSDGDAEFNLGLSLRRADAVRTYLIGKGVDGARLSTIGYGEDRLKVDPEASDEDKFQNRRIEFVVSS